MTLPIKYRKDPPYIRSFNFIDIIQGQSYGTFYLTAGYDDTNTLIYKIIPTSCKVGPGIINVTPTSYSEYTKDGDFDFDILVDKSFSLQGNAFVEMSISADATGSYYNTTGYAIVKLRKWDGSTETEIGNGKTVSVTGDNLENDCVRQLLIIPITTKVNFSKGEYLRVTVEMWCIDNNESGSGSVSFYVDPSNSNNVEDYKSLMKNLNLNIAAGSASTPTDLLIHLPFVNNT